MNPSLPLSCLLLTASLACLGPKLKADFEAKLNHWVGRPVSEFIQANGRPTKVSAQPDGGQTYVFDTKMELTNSDLTYRSYHDSKTGLRVEPQLPGDPTPSGGQVVARDESVPMRNNLYCRLILETNAEGIVLKSRYEGNNCW